MCRPLTPWFMRERHQPEPLKCHACGEPLDYEYYTLLGNDYCRECAEEEMRDNPDLFTDAISDFLAERRTTL